jgi:hypothetical protein
MVERTSTVFVTFGWLVVWAFVAVFSFYLMNILPVTIGAGIAAVFHLARLHRALREAGNRPFALWFSLGIILTLAALSPTAQIVFWKFQFALRRHQHG